jgi:hypothetical protein
MSDPLELHMLILYGYYRFAVRRIAYRNDYCLRCDGVRMAELIQTFNVGHLFFIPLLPLGRWRRWLCMGCGHNPHERQASSPGFKLFVAITFALLTVFGFLMPITRPEDVPIAWGFRSVMLLGFLGALAWCRTKPPTNLKEQLLGVPPLPQDVCALCHAALDARGFCAACKATRLEVTRPGAVTHPQVAAK